MTERTPEGPHERTVGPVRVQLRRTKGWRMPPNTVKVDRTTRWGNPFFVAPPERTQAEAVSAYRTWLLVDGCHAGIDWRRARILRNLDKLRGKNLACWCKPGAPCHADVLLELANAGPNAGAKRPHRSRSD